VSRKDRVSREGGGGRGKSLRARLALLYAGLLLGSGFLLLVIADLPLTSFSRAGKAHPAGGPAGPGAQPRFATNLPQVLLYSGIALVILAAASLALGWLVADRALRPLRAITGAARVISASSLGERLSLAGSYDEFRELAGTLDGLLARLEAAFESQRRFVANASHELRTPLAAERAVLQVAPARNRCGRPAGRPLSSGRSKSTSSTRCSRWPAASAGCAARCRSTWPR
jgi:signal transduction histidine kinase